MERLNEIKSNRKDIIRLTDKINSTVNNLTICSYALNDKLLAIYRDNKQNLKVSEFYMEYNKDNFLRLYSVDNSNSNKDNFNAITNVSNAIKNIDEVKELLSIESEISEVEQFDNIITCMEWIKKKTK